MGRSTVYNSITSPEKMKEVNEENIQLGEDFLEYLSSIARSKGTIAGYKNDLDIFWCWNLEHNKNKFFVDLTKRDVVKFQNHALNEWRWSPSRVRRVKAALSSLSNYVENMLDDEFQNYRPIIRKIESPVQTHVREKTVFTEDQLQHLLDQLVENGDYDKACMLSMAMNNGRRKSELPRMKTSYFDDSNLMLGGSLYQTPEKVKTKGRGILGKPLTIYTLAKPFQPYLKLWVDYRKENGIESEWLIPRKVGNVYVDEQVPITMMDSWAETFSRLSGVPFYWHSLRHYFTTKLSESNIPDSIIQELIGWESADMCRIYNDTSVDAKLSKYFGEEGIKQVESKTIQDL